MIPLPRALQSTLMAFAASLIALPICAQEWTAEIGLAHVWQDVDGSAASYSTQTNLADGFALEGLLLDYHGSTGAISSFSVDAWGFGDAEPTEQARLGLGIGKDLDLSLRFERRESLFGLTESDLGVRADSWEVMRWTGTAVWDGWSSIRASLVLRRVDRDGTVQRPFYGLDQLYLQRVELDESMTEATLRLETKTLPVNLVLEQSLAQYERENRRFPSSTSPVGGNDPDLLADTGVTFSDEQNVPTSRLVASYRSDRFEGAASLLWSTADLDATGAGWTSFAVGGGTIGSVELVDDLVGSAERDTLAANVHLGFLLSDRWLLRLRGDYRDASTDAALLGDRLIRVANPTGSQLELGAPVAEAASFDFTDSTAGLTLEHRADAWSVWVGGFSASRDVQWRLAADDPGLAVSRDSDGYLVGASWSLSQRLSGSIEHSSGSFERYVFRTDPKDVDRLTLKLRADLGSGWRLNLHGRHERTENPLELAALDHSAKAAGVGLGWASAEGDHGFGLDLERIDLNTDTGLVLPGGRPGVSAYDLDLTSATFFGQTVFGSMGVRGSITRITDNGATWPVDAWNASGRISFPVGGGMELAAFAQIWSYDEEHADRDDFDVTRYGVAVHWRFE